MEHTITFQNFDSLPESIKKAIIELQEKEAYERKESTIMKKHRYKIYHEKSGKWATYILDDESGKRRKIRRKSKEDLILYLYNYYFTSSTIPPTIKNVYMEYLNKSLYYHKIKKSTFDRYLQVYRRFLSGTEYEKKYIGEIDEIYLENMILDIILEKNISSKAYASFRTIIRQTFNFAEKNNLTEIDIYRFFRKLEVSKNMFTKKVIDRETEIFHNDEVPIIKEYLWGHPSIHNLAILLDFNTGMRVGELVCLKFEDIDDNFIHVRRHETKYRTDDNFYKYDVLDFAKTEAGIRDVVLTDEAKAVFSKIESIYEDEFKKESNGSNLDDFDKGYIFTTNRNRICGANMNKYLRRACNNAGIKPRSMHKIRRTYATKLIEARVNSATICGQLGHSNIKTTYKYYIKENKNKEQIQAEIQGVFNSSTSDKETDNKE